MREVPRRLTPSPEERLRNIVSTVASGSDQGSTLFARRVSDSTLAAVRSVAAVSAPAFHNYDSYVILNIIPFTVAPNAQGRIDTVARISATTVGTAVSWSTSYPGVVGNVAGLYQINWNVQAAVSSVVFADLSHLIGCDEGAKWSGLGRGAYYATYTRVEFGGPSFGNFTLTNYSSSTVTVSGSLSVTPILY